MTLVLFIAGFGLLVVGGELLIRGSSRLASALGLSPLIIGLTIVAFGTGAPELSVSLMASMKGQADVALGNVVGSNIFNVLVILGASAMVAPLTVAQRLIRWDVPIMIAVSLAVIPLSFNRVIGGFEGALLVLGLAGYTFFVIRSSKRESAAINEEYRQKYKSGSDGRRHLIAHAILVLAGLGLLVLGTRWFVDGAVAMARYFGVSELVIGLTIVATGTSLPEIFTSIIATRRGELDIAVGNVVGSNIFNILGVLGFSALFTPQGVGVAPAAINFDIPVMIAVMFACLPIFFTGHRIDRWEGLVFLLYYAAYAAFLVLDARDHDALPVFSRIMLWFVIPITVLTLGIGVRRYAKSSRNQLRKA